MTIQKLLSSPFSRLLSGAAFASALLLTPACADGTADGEPEAGEPEGEPEGNEPLSDDAIIALADDYENGGFTEMSEGDFTSDHGGATVAVFINDDAVDDYDAIDTGAATGPTFAEGTMIIKQHKDGVDGNHTARTIMYKQPAGYSDTGDWWWARVEENGDRTVVGASPAGCLGCHTEVEGSDYVYGIE